MHVKGYAAPETKAAAERARLLIEQAEALGEPPEDPLLLFSVLYGFWVANYVAFNGDAMRELAAQFLALAEKQRATAPAHDWASPDGHFADVDWGYRRRPSALTIRRSRFTIAAEHRPLATRFGQDDAGGNPVLVGRWPLWLLGYPEAALADADQRAQGCARDRSSCHA